MVVDDEEDAREALATLLHAEGHETLAVNDGPAAVMAARTFDPDVILLDIGLPKVDGYQVARALRSEYANSILLVALTGYQADAARLKQAGFDHHLIKPATTQTISTLLASWGGEARR